LRKRGLPRNLKPFKTSRLDKERSKSLIFKTNKFLKNCKVNLIKKHRRELKLMNNRNKSSPISLKLQSITQ